MVTKTIIKGISNAKCSTDITNKSNAKGHDQYSQKHGTKGKSKGKGNDNIEDNEINKGFPEEGPQWLV